MVLFFFKDNVKAQTETSQMTLSSVKFAFFYLSIPSQDNFSLRRWKQYIELTSVLLILVR